MVREFEYKGEVFRVNYHGISGHEEIIIVHLEDRVMEEGGEISIDRMTEENDTTAPLEEICQMLCDRLIPEREIAVRDPGADSASFELDVCLADLRGTVRCAGDLSPIAAPAS